MTPWISCLKAGTQAGSNPEADVVPLSPRADAPASIPASKGSSPILSLIPICTSSGTQVRHQSHRFGAFKYQEYWILTYCSQTLLSEGNVESAQLYEICLAIFLVLVDVLAVIHHLGARGDQWHTLCQLFAEILDMVFVNLEEGEGLSSLWETTDSVFYKLNSASESMASLQNVALDVVKIQRGGCGSHV